MPPCWWLRAATPEPSELHLQAWGSPRVGKETPSARSSPPECSPGLGAAATLSSACSLSGLLLLTHLGVPGMCLSSVCQLGTKYNSPVVFWARLTCRHPGLCDTGGLALLCPARGKLAATAVPAPARPQGSLAPAQLGAPCPWDFLTLLFPHRQTVWWLPARQLGAASSPPGL